MIVEELQKRPFVRPLFLWIAGILLQICFPVQGLSAWLLLPVLAALGLSFLLTPRNGGASIFRSRLMWGVMLSFIIVFMSIHTTAYYETHDPPVANKLVRYARTTQSHLAHKLDVLQLSDDEKSVLATITISYRQALPRDVRKKFSTIGVAHILAVSGFHVGIVYSALLLLFSPFPKRRYFKWIKAILILLCLWSFAFIAGMGVSTVRATLMASTYLMGKTLGLHPERYNTLAAAAFILLVYDPYNLFDIGFQLSFTAVLFIFWLHRPLKRLIPLRNPLLAAPWDVLTITLAAQIGVTFLCCFYFGTFSTIFLISNLILSLLATLVIPIALFWMLLTPWFPFIDLWMRPIEWLTHSFVWFVDRFSMVSWAILPVRFDWLTTVLAYISLGLLLLYFRTRRPRTLITSMAALLVILVWQVAVKY